MAPTSSITIVSEQPAAMAVMQVSQAPAAAVQHQELRAMVETAETLATVEMAQTSPPLMNPVAPVALAEQAAVRPALALQVTAAMAALGDTAHRDRSPAAQVTAQRVAKAVRAALAARRSQARPAMVATVATAARPELAPMEQHLRLRVTMARLVVMADHPVPAVLEVRAAVQPLGKTATVAMAATVATRAEVAMVAMARPALGRHLMAQRVGTAG